MVCVWVFRALDGECSRAYALLHSPRGVGYVHCLHLLRRSPLLHGRRCWWPLMWRPAACTSATCPSESAAQPVVGVVAVRVWHATQRDAMGTLAGRVTPPPWGLLHLTSLFPSA